ncbi:MAG: hypothetical protein DRI36_03760 [Caldiserica bacterium]|nr:MAG: hypothetical protein DRI36_03760 [Caldisericota bacterium]
MKRKEKVSIDKNLFIKGIIVYTLAFIVLFFTDPEGKNFASFLSPLLFVLAILIITFSLLGEGE